MIVLVGIEILIIDVLWHCLAINISWSPLILNNVLYMLLYMYGLVLLYTSSFDVWNGTSLCFFMLLYQNILLYISSFDVNRILWGA